MYGSIYYEPYWLNEDELEHYGVKGMKWGIRKSEDKGISKSSSKKSSNFKRNIAIGSAIAISGLAIYGGYRYGKFIKDENVKLAIKNGTKMMQHMKASDIRAAQRHPDIFSEKPDSYYDKIIKDAADKARSQSFKEAYKNVKASSNALKQKAKQEKQVINNVKKTIKEIRTGKIGFGTFSMLSFYQHHSPELLEQLGVKIVDGHVFENGKKIY